MPKYLGLSSEEGKLQGERCSLSILYTISWRVLQVNFISDFSFLEYLKHNLYNKQNHYYIITKRKKRKKRRETFSVFVFSISDHRRKLFGITSCFGGCFGGWFHIETAALTTLITLFLNGFQFLLQTRPSLYSKDAWGRCLHGLPSGTRLSWHMSLS